MMRKKRSLTPDAHLLSLITERLLASLCVILATVYLPTEHTDYTEESDSIRVATKSTRGHKKRILYTGVFLTANVR